MYIRNSPSLWLWHNLIGLLQRLYKCCLELCSARLFLDDVLWCLLLDSIFQIVFQKSRNNYPNKKNTQSHYIIKDFEEPQKAQKPKQFFAINWRANYLKKIVCKPTITRTPHNQIYFIGYFEMTTSNLKDTRTKNP